DRVGLHVEDLADHLEEPYGAGVALGAARGAGCGVDGQTRVGAAHGGECVDERGELLCVGCSGYAGVACVEPRRGGHFVSQGAGGQGVFAEQGGGLFGWGRLCVPASFAGVVLLLEGALGHRPGLGSQEPVGTFGVPCRGAFQWLGPPDGFDLGGGQSLPSAWGGVAGGLPPGVTGGVQDRDDHLGCGEPAVVAVLAVGVADVFPVGDDEGAVTQQDTVPGRQELALVRFSGAVAGRFSRSGLDGLASIPYVPVVGGEQDGAACPSCGVEQGAEFADLCDRPGGFVSFSATGESVVDGVEYDTDDRFGVVDVFLHG